MVEPLGGGGGTLILSHIRRLGLFLGVLNFNIFGVFRKMNIFLDIMKILWIFFGGGSSQIGLVLG